MGSKEPPIFLNEGLFSIVAPDNSWACTCAGFRFSVKGQTGNCILGFLGLTYPSFETITTFFVML